jgi:ABC-type dipeptide/oligopeptide/nickel transport system ATPase component
MGLAMLFITHDLSVLVEVCDRLAIMYAGKIVEEGPSAPVFAKPAHPYTEALAAAFPRSGTSLPQSAVRVGRGSATAGFDPFGLFVPPALPRRVRRMPQRHPRPVRGRRRTKGRMPAQ